MTRLEKLTALEKEDILYGIKVTVLQTTDKAKFDDLSEKTRFKEDLDFDSYDMMLFLLDLETFFDVEIEVGKDASTIGDITKLLIKIRDETRERNKHA